MLYCAVCKEVDYAWEHGEAIKKKNRSQKYVKCIYCGHEVSCITRLKSHLANVKGDVKVCDEVPAVVREGFLDNFCQDPYDPNRLILKRKQNRVPPAAVVHDEASSSQSVEMRIPGMEKRLEKIEDELYGRLEQVEAELLELNKQNKNEKMDAGEPKWMDNLWKLLEEYGLE